MCVPVCVCVFCFFQWFAGFGDFRASSGLDFWVFGVVCLNPMKP